MDRPDRKRAFSRAFQSTSRDIGEALRQAARNVVASSIASTPSGYYTPSASFGCNKENEVSFFEGKNMTPIAPGAPQVAYNQHQGLVPLAIPARRSLPSPRQPLEELSKEQYTGNGNSGQMLPPPAKHSPLGFSGLAQDQSLLSSSPPSLDFESTSPLGDVLGPQMSSEPGPVVYEEPDAMMYDQYIPAVPLTPSELNLQDLSLLDIPRHPLHAVQSQPMAPYHRASVSIVQSAIFHGYVHDIARRSKAATNFHPAASPKSSPTKW